MLRFSRPLHFLSVTRASFCACKPLLRTWRRKNHSTFVWPTPVDPADIDPADIEDFGDYRIILPPKFPRRGVKHIRTRDVPKHIMRPSYAYPDGKDEVYGDGRISLGGDEECRLKQAASLAKDVLQYAGSLVEMRVPTIAIDEKVHDYIVAHNAYPSPLHYEGFPRSCCTSVNNIITHGIPNGRRLQDGDIINIDITVYLNGYHGDTSQTFLVGDVDDEGRALVRATNDALRAAMLYCGPGQPFKGIGKAIHAIASERGYCVSPQFSGHCIGKAFHSPPWIIHELNDEPGNMLPGHCFTIEPILIQGSDPKAWIFPDGWTTSTENCARGAQAEHMVLITETGSEILTSWYVSSAGSTIKDH